MNQSTISGGSDVNTYHYVKGSIVQNSIPGQVAFEITEDFKREKVRETSSQQSIPHEPVVIKKLLNLENMVCKLIDNEPVTSTVPTKQDSFEARSENRRKRQENNGWVRLSERLDVIFMTFFISAVTIPVAYLFICMWAWSEDY